MSKILITGGAGFIGSHICKLLIKHGYSCMAVDHMIKDGKRTPSCQLRVGDVADIPFMEKVFIEFQPDSVIHLAAYSNPLESIRQPNICYSNNIVATDALLQVMARHQVKNLIFASSSMVYSEQDNYDPYKEITPRNPDNPYSASKLMGERLIEDYSNVYGLRYIIMRHFNPSGVGINGEAEGVNIGNNHAVATMTKVALGKLPEFTFYGTDYPTPDGSSIRDYVHVGDVATAHLQALRYLAGKGDSLIVNIGTGNGTSLRQLLTAIEAYCGHPLPVKYQPRRVIYQPYLVADISSAKQYLDWEPLQSSLEIIIGTTFRGFTNETEKSQ